MRTVTAPDGRKWKLGRRWLPGRPRTARAKLRDFGDWTFIGSDDDLGILGAIFLVAIAIAGVVFVALVLFNVVAIALELLLLAIVLLAGVVGRVVFRRPWTIYAKSQGRYWATDVKGWRASGRALDDAAERIRSGAELEPAPGDRR